MNEKKNIPDNKLSNPKSDSSMDSILQDKGEKSRDFSSLDVKFNEDKPVKTRPADKSTPNSSDSVKRVPETKKPVNQNNTGNIENANSQKEDQKSNRNNNRTNQVNNQNKIARNGQRQNPVQNNQNKKNINNSGKTVNNQSSNNQNRTRQNRPSQNESNQRNNVHNNNVQKTSSQNNGSTQNIRNAQNMRNTQNNRSAQDGQNPQNMKNNQNNRNTKSIRSSQNNENTQNIRNTQNIKNNDNSQNNNQNKPVVRNVGKTVSAVTATNNMQNGNAKFRNQRVENSNVQSANKGNTCRNVKSDNDKLFEFDEPAVITKDSINKTSKKKIMPYWVKVALITLCVMIFVVAPVATVLAFSSKIHFTDWKGTEQLPETFDTQDTPDPEVSATPSSLVFSADDSKWDNIKGDSRYDENVINILLVGDDEKSTVGYRGNSDSILIASINKTEKSLKLTSIMRDCYVPIPGHSDNKINSSYHTGGIPLLKQTIEENFKISIDSAVVMHFDTFIEAIDYLGGISVDLNKSEAAFIDKKTKYKFDRLKSGSSVKLNGEQSLWFSRIRKISSDVYGHDDFGRTMRQRVVLNQLFKRYKDLNIVQLTTLVNHLVGYFDIDTNLKSQLLTLVELGVSFNVSELETYRFPADKMYELGDVLLRNGKSMSVVKIDTYMQENVDGLHRFIYGDTNY